ncbi:hypothetical protein Tco_1393562 [Tanacetum coccineum]
MDIFVISVSSNSSEESVGTSTGRVILFGTIPTTIPDTTPSMTPPSTHIDTALTPTSPDYTPASPDYSPAFDMKFDPSEESSSDYIPPLPAISPFLSLTDDSSDNDTPDTPPSPTHGRGLGPLPTYRLVIHTDASVPLSSPIPGALSYTRADLLPSPKRVRSSEFATDLEGCSEDSFEPYVPREARLGVDFEDESSEPSRSRGTDLGMVVMLRGVMMILTFRFRTIMDVRVRELIPLSQRRELRVQREIRQIRHFRFYDRMRTARLMACTRALGIRALRARDSLQDLDTLWKRGKQGKVMEMEETKNEEIEIAEME